MGTKEVEHQMNQTNQSNWTIIYEWFKRNYKSPTYCPTKKKKPSAHAIDQTNHFQRRQKKI